RANGSVPRGGTRHRHSNGWHDLFRIGELESLADFISRRTLGRNTPYRSDQSSKLPRGDVLAEIRSCCLRNAFFHQRAAEIVGPGFQASQRLLVTKLHPGDLNIRDVSVQKHTTKRVNDYILVRRMSRARASNLEELGLRVDESQRNKFSESAGFLLNFAQQKQMPYPMFGPLGVAIHHSRRRRNAKAVRGFNHFNPLPYFQFIRT